MVASNGKISIPAKGQLISKQIFNFSILPQNKRKISALVGQGKILSFRGHFFGELETRKICFEII